MECYAECFQMHLSGCVLCNSRSAMHACRLRTRMPCGLSFGQGLLVSRGTAGSQKAQISGTLLLRATIALNIEPSVSTSASASRPCKRSYVQAGPSRGAVFEHGVGILRHCIMASYQSLGAAIFGCLIWMFARKCYRNVTVSWVSDVSVLCTAGPALGLHV